MGQKYLETWDTYEILKDVNVNTITLSYYKGLL
jgi:hypothetical protein